MSLYAATLNMTRCENP